MVTNTGIKVVAEVANCHAGSLEYLDRLITEVAKGGFKHLKFQIYTARELLHPLHPRYDHFKVQEFSFETWKEIVSRTNSFGMVPIADVYGLESLNQSLDLGIRHLKIPSSSRNISRSILSVVSRVELEQIYYSVTALTFYEISKRIEFLRSSLKPDIPITLIHGHQEFPTPLENSNIALLKRLKEKFGQTVNVGFADHTEPDKDGIADACLVAIGAGANYIEKHVSLERDITKVDFHSSIKPHQFKSFTETLQRSTLLMTPNVESEKLGIENYQAKMRKFPIVRKDLPPGTLLTDNDFDYLRVENPSGVLTRLKGGEVTLTSLAKGATVKFENLTHRVSAVVLCRSDSKRLPNKALRPIASIIPIIHLLNRLKRTKFVDDIVLATTDRVEDDELSSLVKSHGFSVYRGSNLDVLGRMLNSAQQFQPNQVIRITGDDILLSTDDLADAIKEHVMMESHYTNMLSVPSGTEAEIFDFDFLHDFYRSRDIEWDTEYLTNCLNEISRDEFRTHSYRPNKNRNRAWRLTLDTEEDWEVLNTIFQHLQREEIQDSYNLDDVIRVIESDEHLLHKVKKSPKRNHIYPQSTKYLNWIRP